MTCIMQIMAENPEKSIMQVINESKQYMIGNKLNLFFLELTFLGWLILSIFTCGIGMVFLNPYMTATRTMFYFNVTGKNNSGEGEI